MKGKESLARELARAKERLRAQEGELARLRRMAKGVGEGVRELEQVARALHLGMALRFGEQVESGVWELELPAGKGAEGYGLRYLERSGSIWVQAYRNTGEESGGAWRQGDDTEQI